MDMNEFSVINLTRCEAKDGFDHPLDLWSLSDWMIATAGELGEAANFAKKLNRVRDGIGGNRETPEELRDALADELADTFIYLDLLAQSQGIRLADAVIRKFNRTSDKIGCSIKIGPTKPTNARAIIDIANERCRQIAEEGWTAEHDDRHMNAELAAAAASYLMAVVDPDEEAWSCDEQRYPFIWPWDAKWWKPGDPRRMLVKAGALIAAQIDRIDRQRAAGRDRS